MSYLNTVNEKKAAAQQQKELADNLRELKRIQMATAAFQSKPSVVLTDQTDLGDKIKELTGKLTKAVEGLDTSVYSKQQVEELKTLHKGLETLTRAIYNQVTDNRSLNSDVVKAIKALNIKIPAPIVNVDRTPVDLSPLQDTIKEYFTPPEAKIDLNCYRAQDITDSDDKQYVGFLNPNGDWYIIENKVRENTLRYVFGHGDYAKAFKDAPSYQYSLLDEAINAIRS